MSQDFHDEAVHPDEFARLTQCLLLIASYTNWRYGIEGQHVGKVEVFEAIRHLWANGTMTEHDIELLGRYAHLVDTVSAEHVARNTGST